MCSAIASDDVAAGEGALRTCSAAPACESTKSSMFQKKLQGQFPHVEAADYSK